jgi:hypothetical protein
MTNTHKTTIALFTAFTAATTLASASVAHAQAAQQTDPANVVNATPAPAATATSADPNIDRGFLLPTAMTQPAGSVTYNNYELLLHGVSYGITDRLQLSATVLAPIVKEFPFVGNASLKWQVYRGQRLHLALQGSLGGGYTSDGDAGAFMAGLGGLTSVCIRQDCSSLLSASVTYQLISTDRDARNSGLIYGVSLVHRVGPHVKLLAEVASASLFSSGDLKGNGGLFSYGVRFYSNNIAADIGFMKPFGGDGADFFLMGFPFASVSYRWQ